MLSITAACVVQEGPCVVVVVVVLVLVVVVVSLLVQA
jgi:hypothetical protein